MSGKPKTKKQTIVELGVYDYDVKYDLLQKIGFFATYHKLNAVSVPISFLDKVKPYLLNVKTACLIDAPYGLSLLEIKHHSIIKAIHKEAEIIELVLNNNLIINKEWEKLQNELKTCLELCRSKQVEFRIAIDWRLMSEAEAIELCNAVAYAGVDCIITSNGYTPDDPSDNIILAQKAQKTHKIPVICSSVLFKPFHLESIRENKHIYGLRINNYELAKRFLGDAGV